MAARQKKDQGEQGVPKRVRRNQSLPKELEVGMLVKFRDGEDRGTYEVMSVTLSPDGSVSLYGGDLDPNGRRGYRAVMPERLMLEDRRNVLIKRHRQDQ